MTGSGEAKSWSNLPDDIIILIINRLYYIDQICFLAVCKNWREAARNNVVKYADKLPWIMAYNSSSCFLYDPYHKRQYTVYRGDDTRISREIADSRVLDSKHGWVLFSQERISSVFFYNPFTDTIIRLPRLPTLYVHHVATFSATPDSLDCMVFVFVPVCRQVFCVNICKLGETQWTEFTYDGDYGSCIENVEFLDGIFYCSFSSCDIGAFNTAVREWSLLPCPPIVGDMHTSHTSLINCDGELLMVVQTYDYGDDDHYKWIIFRCDRQQWNWIVVESLENRSLFLSHAFLSHSSMCIPVESEFENKIHLQYPYNPRTEYRLYAEYQYQPRQPVRQQISEIYDCTVHQSADLATFWIQPPQPR